MMALLTQTPSQTVGPFFHDGLVHGGDNILVNEQTQGQRITLRGVVRDGDGAPVPDALVEIWQADANGIYAHSADPRVAQADPHFRGFGRSATVDGGQFSFATVKPGIVEGQAPHINLRIFARGMLTHALTRVYFADDPATAQDALLQSIDPARRQTLLAQRTASDSVPVYRFNVVLQGEQETVFFTP